MKRFISILLLFSFIIPFANAEDFDALPMTVSDDQEMCEVTHITFDGREMRVFYNFTGYRDTDRDSNLIMYVSQGGTDCEHNYTQSRHEYTGNGNTVENREAFKLNNSHDIVRIRASIMFDDENMIFYFDPITEKNALEEYELLRYREENLPKMLFSSRKQAGEVISYGKWQYVESLLNYTTEYEFFSNGSFTRNYRPPYNSGTTVPGIYSVEGNTLNMYEVSESGNFYQRTLLISEDGRTLTQEDLYESYQYVEQE